MKLKYILLIILFSLVFFLFFNINSSYAMTDEEIDYYLNYEGKYGSATSFDYYCIYISPTNILNVCMSSEPFYIYYSGDTYRIHCNIYYWFNLNNGVSGCTGSPASTSGNVLGNFNLADINNYIFYSNNDIYEKDTTNVLFQKPPQVVKSLEEVTKEAQLTAKKVTKKILMEELEELVPVGVIILASLVTVSLLAFFPFWKI